MAGKKRIDIPQALVERCDPYLEKRGYNSISELVRGLLREWADMMQQVQLKKSNMLQQQQQMQQADEVVEELLELAKEEDYEELEETLEQIKTE